MSLHVISTGNDPQRMEHLDTLRSLCRRYLREPDSVHETDVVADSSTLSFEFIPDLTTDEERRYARLLSASVSPVRLAPDDLESLLPTLMGLRDYHSLASPTNAQSVAAIKGIIRVLRALLRDE